MNTPTTFVKSWQAKSNIDIRKHGACFNEKNHRNLSESLSPFTPKARKLFHAISQIGRRQIVTAMVVCLLLPIVSEAQNSRQYIKNAISNWGSCRNVVITDTGGDMALNYRNQYAAQGIPTSLGKALEELNEKGEYIDDVQLTEGGRWLILYGNNGFMWNDIPNDLEQALHEYNDNAEVVTSVTLNDYGGWIIISTEHIKSSTEKIRSWIIEGMEQYGGLWAAHLTNDGFALCFERGYRFAGNVSSKLKDELQRTTLNVFRLKFTSGGSYFFADKEGRYEGWM